MTQTIAELNWLELSWPLGRLAEALQFLAPRPADLTHLVAPPTGLHKISDNSADLDRWLQLAGEQLGLDVEAIHLHYNEWRQVTTGNGPAIFAVTLPLGTETPHFVITVKGNRDSITLLCPDFSTRPVPTAELREAWCYEVEAPLLEKLDNFLGQQGRTPSGRQKSRTAVAQDILRDELVANCWLVSPNSGNSLWGQVRHSGLLRPFAILALVTTIQQALQVGGWALIGKGALAGRFDWAWLFGWALIQYTDIFFQSVLFSLQGPFSIGIMQLFKERLLQGALRLDPEEVRSQGSGQFLSRVLESDIVQTFIVGGALRTLPFVTVLIVAAGTLFYGLSGYLLVSLLLAWTGCALYFGWHRLREGDAGMVVYRRMTNELVEHMRGHRTRLAQENRLAWHDDEDKSLAHYMDLSRLFDLNNVRLDILIPRGWLVISMAGVAYGFIFVTTSADRLAISLLGILLGYQAFDALAQSMKFLAQATMSWRQITPLLQAAGRPGDNQTSAVFLPDAPPAASDSQPLLIMRDVVFRYRDRGQAVLQNCHLTIKHGEKYILEGPSGGGKSTLASLVSGLRSPESGILLLWGFDYKTVGSQLWRQRIVFAPQFQENHIFTESLAFNLLMGRNWPPNPADLEEAAEICQELGLGELLERMPDKLMQTVGDGGWQLSHGEKSRIYIGRALLQRADLVILDESFGALDPESLGRAIKCVLKRAPTLLVIAHP